VPYLRGHAATLTVASVVSLFAAAGYLAVPLMIRATLDGLEQGQPVWQRALLVPGLLLGAVIAFNLRDYLLQRTAEGVVLNIRTHIASRLLRLPIPEYDHRRTGDLLSRMGADSTLLRSVVTSSLVQLVTEAVILVGATAMMFLIDPVMAVVTIVVLAGLSGGMLIAQLVRGASAEAQARVGEMTAAMERAITAVRTIRVARAEERESVSVGGAARQAYRAGLRIARLQAAIGPVTVLAFQGGVLTVLVAGGARVAAGALGLGDLVAFVALTFQLLIPINLAMTAYTQLQAGLGALQRIEEVLALPIETVAEVANPPGPDPLAPAIEFDSVSFTYPHGQPVLHDLSFIVPAGARVALVGLSGAGKSTVLALVERFYDPTAGAIRVAGVDLRDQPRHELRGRLGYVEQEAPVLAGTIRENLLLGAPDAEAAELLSVLDAVNLQELVDRAPEGLDAPVGEDGVLLSGGERQRLAIARALLADPPILLLDEPTSHLDARNDHALRLAIETAAARCTLLVVAHRLSTVADADMIMVIDRGRLIATGRHAELLATNPLYRELVTNQLLAA
jgi:ATP-binding cassette subfamily B protein/ATP-binding cassette subfamily C protein